LAGSPVGLSSEEQDVNITGLQIRIAAIIHNVNFFIINTVNE
jgi:hypothetical protein